MWSAWPKFRANGARTAGANESAAAFRLRIFCAPAGESARSPLPKSDAGRNVAGRGQNMRGGKLQIPLRNFSDAQGSFRNPPGASCACRNAMPPDAARRQIRGIARPVQSLPECACFCRNMEIPGVLSFRDWVGKPTRRVLPLRPEFRPPTRFPFPYLCQSQNLFKNPQFPAVSLPGSKKTPPSLPSPAPQASL